MEVANVTQEVAEVGFEPGQYGYTVVLPERKGWANLRLGT